MQSLSRNQWEFDGLEMLPLEPGILANQYTTKKFDLTITFTDQCDEISMIIEYDTVLLQRESIQKIFKQINQLLESIIRNPGQAVKEAAFLCLARKP